MSTEAKTLGSLSSPGPKVDIAAAPLVFIVLFTLLLYWGMVYMNDHGGGFNSQVYEPYDSYAQVDSLQLVDPTGEQIRRGRIVFGKQCATCHQASGLGVPGEKPPLAGSEWVQAQHPNRITRAVLYGLTGPITVKGVTLTGQTMVPWKDVLTTGDIADVLTFVRMNKEWGNNASAVTEAQVTAIKEKVGAGRGAAFTADELLKIPEDQ